MPLEDALRWYYVLEIGFYASLFITQFFDVRRKDFWQMFAHHTIALIQLAITWMTNRVRIGAVFFVVHDVGDWLLEISKLTNYAKWDRLSEKCFVAFTLVWFLSRIVYYPWVLMRSCLSEAGGINPTRDHGELKM